MATTTTPAGAQPTASPAPAVVKRGKHAQLSDILVDNGGRTLYRFTRDVPATSNCSGACAQTWPPLTVAGGAVAAGQGVSAGLGVITPADGTRQVTYSGQPLYYYAADAAPGDAKGESVGTVWFVVKPAGTLVASGTADPSAAY
ncbi:MAG: hypothetical protein EXR43_06475 [Dehalococcoidia bacterium]|nr:hypothetical protein [Dehalococcoidia bacterium]